MKMQTEHFRTQILLEPWKAMAIAAGAGAGLMAALVGILTLALKVLLGK